MKLYLVFLLSLVAIALGDGEEKPSSDEIEVEEEVLVLKDVNFEKAITDNELVLVEFCKYTLNISSRNMFKCNERY